MKSLYSEISWDRIQVIGFDLDGTLYNEHQFIAQVYQEISVVIGTFCTKDSIEIYNWMNQKWLEKGSSYPYIYSEALEMFAPDMEHGETIQQCLDIYRNYKPWLLMERRVTSILSEFKKQYPIFLITDGNYKLQTSKFNALKMDKWFSEPNVGFTGYYGSDYYKPSAKIIEHIPLLHGVNPQNVVYFGDREVDRLFAATAQFQFVKVKCMQPED